LSGHPDREGSGIFLDRGTVDAADVDFTRLGATLPRWEWRRETPAGAVAEAIADKTIVLSNKVWLGGEALEGARRLELICVAATGVNNVDLAA
jgi:glycerate dehydrogenase